MRHISFLILLLFADFAFAITLNSSQTDYETSGNITTSGSGIISSLSGSNDNPNKIKNRHTITTGNSGATSGAYGIKSSGNYNQITNDAGATILTTGSSGRGISITNFSSVYNLGEIITQGSGASSHGIYAGGNDNNISNSFSITSARSNGIFAEGDNNAIVNSGDIISGEAANVYGIRVEDNNSSITNSGNITSTNYAIYNSGAGNVITNSGNLTGGVRLGSATFNIMGGNIGGDVEGLSGSGVVNIGVSDDSAVFNQSSSFLNIDSLNINSGSVLNSYGNITANNISLGANAVLNLHKGGAVNATINAVDSSSLNINSGALFNIGSDSKENDGNFSLLAGGIFSAILGKNNAGNLTIGGLANVSSDSKLVIASIGNQNYIGDGKKFVLIKAANDSTINLIHESNISVGDCGSNVCGLLKFSSVVEGNNLFLIANRIDAKQIIKNENTQKIYQNINHIGEGASGKMREFQLYLDSKNFSEKELTQTINQLSPQSGKSHFIANNNLVNSALKASEIRIDNIRAGLSGIAARNFNAGFFENIFTQNQLLDIFNLQQQGGSLKNGFWVQPFGSVVTQDTVGDDNGYRAILSGVALGADKKMSKSSIIGAALSYARAEIKSLDSYKKNFVNAYQINFYHSGNFNDFFTDNLFGLAFSQYHSNRAIPAVKANAEASYNGYSYFAKARVGMEKRINKKLKFIPEISASFLHNHVNAYKENGADSLNLNVSAIDSDVLEGRAGVGLSWLQKISGIDGLRKIGAVF